MISYIAQCVNLLAVFFQKFITFTSFVGHIIVIFISSITDITITAISNVFLFFQIVYEDNVSIFTEDLPGFATDLADNIIQHGHYVLDLIISTCNEIYYKYHVLLRTLKWSIDTVLFVCGEVLLFWKKTVILVGESLWLVLTFVPVHLPYILKIIFMYVGNCIMNNIIAAYMSLLNFTNFLSDMPLESFIGILLTMLIARLCIHFRIRVQSQIVSIYWKIITNIRYLYYTLYNYLTDSEVRLISLIANGEEISVTDEELNLIEAHNVRNSADALCIICQERQKCVLILPCRHLCLCSECCVTLYNYQRICPICRTFIYHSVSVYL